MDQKEGADRVTNIQETVPLKNGATSEWEGCKEREGICRVTKRIGGSRGSWEYQGRDDHLEGRAHRAPCPSCGFEAVFLACCVRVPSPDTSQ